MLDKTSEISENRTESEVEKQVSTFFKDLWVEQEVVLSQVKIERENWDDYVSERRDEIEADLVLLRNQVKQKGKSISRRYEYTIYESS